MVQGNGVIRTQAAVTGSIDIRSAVDRVVVDVVIVIVPLTDATHHLVDDAFLSAMPDGALLVNVARGPVADTDALVAHAGRLALALDVTDPEPLPDGHPLWSAPDVLITPHAGGNTTTLLPRMSALLRDQLSRVAAGEDPHHLVRRIVKT